MFITKVLSVEELKEIFVETLLNKTPKVTKVSDGSVLNGVAYGCAKVAQKAIKDIAVIESHLFPDSAYGAYLDTIALQRGVAPRLGASQSSMYMLVYADPGTTYTAGVHTFTGNGGVVFDLDSSFVVPNWGWTYAKVRSVQSGSIANVDALSITAVSPQNVGHIYCINEYAGVGGRDFEDDETFRHRIKEEINLLARHTLSYIDQVFIKINPNVLRVFNGGFNDDGDVILSILTVNGIDLTLSELDDLFVKGEKYFCLTDLRPNNGYTSYGVELRNINWQPVDISFRCDVDNSFNVDIVRRNIQVSMNKELDYRFWDDTRKVEWDNLLQIVKGTDGIKYVPDTYFFPGTDTVVDKIKIPRIRGFRMMDLDGNIIVNYSGTLNPVYYQSEADFSFQASVLSSI